jgi:quercetin dioxygenase-like cupin family protein
MDAKTDTKSSLRILEDWSLCDACPDADMVSKPFQAHYSTEPDPAGILHDSNHLAGTPGSAWVLTLRSYAAERQRLLRFWCHPRTVPINRRPASQGASVTFEPGARTAWHTHPLGQILIATAGCGWAQREGGPIEEIRPGDVVWFAPGEKHWHGASPATGMTHIAVQEKKDGKVVDWMEHVSDEQYGSRQSLNNRT